MPTKIYTAREMRDVAKCYFCSEVPIGFDKRDIAAMLRQAADAEEELASVKASKNRWIQYQETAAGERNACIDELRKKDAEIAQLKARLDAVEKECEKRMKEYDCGACDFTDEPPWTFEQCEIKGCPTRLHAMEFLSILRVARSE